MLQNTPDLQGLQASWADWDWMQQSHGIKRTTLYINRVTNKAGRHYDL